MPHPSEHGDAGRILPSAEAEGLAEALRAFGSASRLKLLWALLDGEQTVEALAAAAEMEQSAVSHQLRLLRQQRLVAVRRELLAALRNHYEHVNPPQTGSAGDLAEPPARARTRRRAR
jgi:DNA-binding transcriptional ArsR family regulator